MESTNDIFIRATLSNMAQYLLYGEKYKTEKADYSVRIDKVQKACETILARYESDKESALYHVFYDLMFEYEKVYMEMGFRAGMVLIQNAFKDFSEPKYSAKFENDAVYTEMYEVLLHGILIVLKKLEKNSLEETKEVAYILKNAQCKANKIFINSFKMQ